MGDSTWGTGRYAGKAGGYPSDSIGGGTTRQNEDSVPGRGRNVPGGTEGYVQGYEMKGADQSPKADTLSRKGRRKVRHRASEES